MATKEQDLRTLKSVLSNPIRLKSIMNNIIRTPVLVSILIASLLISIILPVYATISVAPEINNQLLSSIENDASRTTLFFKSSFFTDDRITEKYHISDELSKSLDLVTKSFQIKKIKLFSRAGIVVYSSDPKEVGEINKNRYFHNIVMKGGKYSKLAKKNEQTLEGVPTSIDIAEIYVPIMNNSKFSGAFEIYYDITQQKQELNSVLKRFSFLILLFSFTFPLFVIAMLMNTSNDMILKHDAAKKLQQTNDYLETQVKEKTNQIVATQRTSIKALAILAEFHDSTTGEHLARIQEYVVLLASRLRENSAYSQYIKSKKDFIEEISLASLLHDIGKTVIPKDLLTKPGKLTDEEFEIVKKHTLIAGDVLNKANSTFTKHFNKDSYLALARDIALFHHEKWNGKGYPFQLKEDHIPLSARIVALADVYDALSCRRSYKEPFPHQFIVEQIKKDRGEHFDPIIVDAFLALENEFDSISSTLCQDKKEEQV